MHDPDTVKAIRKTCHIPDENILTLWKAIKECPKTWQELEKKSVKLQQGRDRLN
jgi:hypothetical protein